MLLGKPFDRKRLFMLFEYYISKGWGSFEELCNLTMYDLREIQIAIESRRQEEKLENAGI